MGLGVEGYVVVQHLVAAGGIPSRPVVVEELVGILAEVHREAERQLAQTELHEGAGENTLTVAEQCHLLVPADFVFRIERPGPAERELRDRKSVV